MRIPPNVRRSNPMTHPEVRDRVLSGRRVSQRWIDTVLNIAELECRTGMCRHVIDGEHPLAVVFRDGRSGWRLSDGRVWFEEQDVPEKRVSTVASIPGVW